MIDEKKLIEELQRFANSNEMIEYTTAYDVVQDCIAMVENQPKTDWIPCEVKLPKTNGVYQVIREIKEGEVTYHIPTASYFDGQNTWHNDICVNFGRQNEQNVIAWQPIQPYKKEGVE